MSLELKFKNMSLVTDSFGEYITIKMVQVYKDGKLIKNAKINQQLMQTVSDAKMVVDGVILSVEVKSKLQKQAEKYKANNEDYLNFILALSEVDPMVGSFKVEKTLLYLMLIEKKRHIDWHMLSSLSKAKLETIKEVVIKYKTQIDAYNSSLIPTIF